MTRRAPTDAPENGATPIPMTIEDIGSAPIRAAVDADPDLAVSAIHRLIELGGRDGAGGIPPEKHAKSIKRHNWLFALIAALFGSGGMVGAYYATEARSKSNAEAIEKHETAPMHDAAGEKFILIENRMGQVEDDLGEIKTGQHAIKEGIDELKKEQVDDLKRELELERRRNRRLRDNR